MTVPAIHVTEEFALMQLTTSLATVLEVDSKAVAAQTTLTSALPQCLVEIMELAKTPMVDSNAAAK